MKNIAIFASGKGSNAENISKYFEESEIARIVLICTNNKNAGVLDRAKMLGLRSLVFNTEELSNGSVLQKLQASKVDLIVLAGFLKKIPDSILEAYPNRVINIHPALLPDYGGEGMYGKHVHQAVVDNEEEETGITIHYVSDEYDEGEIIFQESVDVDPDDTPEDVAYKVHQLEYQHYPAVIEWVIQELDE